MSQVTTPTRRSALRATAAALVAGLSTPPAIAATQSDPDDESPATEEDYAALKFDAIVCLGFGTGPTSRKAYLERAAMEYGVFQLAVRMLGKNDVELEAEVEASGPEPFLLLCEDVGALHKKYAAGLDVLESVNVRLLCGIARYIQANPGAADLT
jgi:hypothetical protein